MDIYHEEIPSQRHPTYCTLSQATLNQPRSNCLRVVLVVGGVEAPVAVSKLADRQDARLPRPTALTIDAQTITDVCSGEELPEVEIISLLEEQIPKYRLRADTLTSFSGYENDDWYCPALKADDVSPLTPEQIRETLNYFLYCSERMRQMNRTYDDIEAVRRLLGEKEHELELVTRIGQNLLSEKTKLQSDISTLKDDLSLANEKITQLSHELAQKSELINNLLSDVDDIRGDGASGSGAGASQLQVSLLERKIKTLEEENRGLMREAAKLLEDNETCEETEARLVGELTLELNTGREELEMSAVENARLREEKNQLREVVDHLEARLHSTDEKLAQVVRENEEYIQIINIMRETQGELTAELADVKERFNEVSNFLEEYKEEERRSKKKLSPKVRIGPGYTQLSSPWPPPTRENPESIGAELSASLLSELSLDSGLGGASTVLGGGSAFGGIQRDDLDKTMLEGFRPRELEDRRLSYWDIGGCSTPDSFLSHSVNMSSIKCDKVQLVKPLEGSETLRQWSQLATPSMDGLLEERPGVKVRGGTELEDLGIQSKNDIKGARKNANPSPDLKVETNDTASSEVTYSLSDVEEDEDSNPGKSFSDTGHVYTFTNSRIMHPRDNIANCVTSSSCSSQMVWSAPGVGSSMVCTPSVPPTPTPANSPTYTPMSTPASTPANSPASSPERPSSPVQATSALFNPYSYLDIIKKTLGSALTPLPVVNSNCKALIRPDNKAVLKGGFRLVEKIERIGLEEILCQQPPRGLHRASLLRRGVRSLARGELLGVPGRPGTGVLDNRLKQLRRPRTDLGSVPSPSSTGLSLSSFVFGRKGGLL